MQISALEVRVCDLELIAALRSATVEHRRRPVVLVRVVPSEGPEGWGECAALAEPTYASEYANGAADVLARFVLPRLLAAGSLDADDPAADAMARLSAIRGHAMAKAAVEMALLDAHLRAEQRSLAEHLGVTRRSVPAGATISAGEPEAVLAAASAVAAAGYRRLKCKVAPGRDVASVRAVAEAYPRLVLSVDANGSYDLSDPAHRRRLEALDGLGLAAIEQPLAPGELAGHAELARVLDTPVLLDESVEDRADLEAAIARHALDGLALKPGRLGGIRAAVAARDAAVAAGLHLAIGGMFETGLARAAHLVVAALEGFDLPGDLGASDRYFVPDLTEAHELVDGELVVPTGPGLGRRPDPLQLSRLTRALAVGTAGASVGEALTWVPAPPSRRGPRRLEG
ncbi:MAG: o-succinylbenzoate synthase [Actinomycetota bacterium]|nr:o-succinylbenzoate synthase [Actinomycetota bacterium]